MNIFLLPNTVSRDANTIYIAQYVKFFVFNFAVAGLIILRPKDFMHNVPTKGIIISCVLFAISSCFDSILKEDFLLIQTLFVSCIIPLYALCIEKYHKQKAGFAIVSLISLLVVAVAHLINFKLSMLLYMYMIFCYLTVPLFVKTYNNMVWYISVIPFALLITFGLGLIYTYDPIAQETLFSYLIPANDENWVAVMNTLNSAKWFCFNPSANPVNADSSLCTYTYLFGVFGKLPTFILMTLQSAGCFAMWNRSFNLKYGRNRLVALVMTLVVTMQLAWSVSTSTGRTPFIAVGAPFLTFNGLQYCVVPILLFFYTLYQDTKVEKSDKNFLTWFDKIILAKDDEEDLDAKKHFMKLTTENFNKFKNGQKSIELRLLDEKRRCINIGDTIVFTDTNTGECLERICTRLHFSDSFVELFEQIGDNEMCGFSKDTNITDMCEHMRMYYSEYQEKDFGVVGIEVSIR